MLPALPVVMTMRLGCGNTLLMGEVQPWPGPLDGLDEDELKEVLPHQNLILRSSERSQ